MIGIDNNRVIVHYSIDFFLILFFPFIHHGHVHRIAYVPISHLKWLKIDISIKSNDFWCNVWWYCICSRWIRCFKLIIHYELRNINQDHECWMLVTRDLHEWVAIRASNFQIINFHEYNAVLPQKKAIWSGKLEPFSDPVLKRLI